MFRKYGILGIVMVLFAQLNFVFKIQPFANWYFPIIWFGYIFTIDAINYKIKGRSLISTTPKKFVFILLISAIVWWIFEFINIALGNWFYKTTLGPVEGFIFATISFSTVIPAVFETFELIKTFHLFDHTKLKKKHRITKHLLHTMTVIGILFLLSPIVLPEFAFPLIWGSFYFILDPINYLHKQPSMIQHLKDKKLIIPISLLLAGILCGLLWEFWNYWAIPKWFYSVPYAGSFKIFEMPLPGYIGYLPFAWSLYAMYYFTKTLRKEEKKFLHKLFK